MKKDAFTMSLLYDYYGQTLTEKQALCFDLYHNQDFSLAEIAEEIQISRQGVHDLLSRAENALRNCEQKIGCIARAGTNRKALQKIRNFALELAALDGAKVRARQILAALEQIKE